MWRRRKRKAAERKGKDNSSRSCHVLFHCIALFLRDLNVRHFQLNLRQRLVARSVPRRQHPYLFRFGVLYNHSGFQSDSSISPWDSITAMQLQLGGPKVTAYGKASWIWSVLVDCLWNICGTYSYMNIYCVTSVTIESIEHLSRHGCSPSPSHPTWLSHGNNCAKHGYLHWHGSLAVTSKIVIFAHMSTPSAASSAVLFRKHWISWAVQDPVNDLVFTGSFAKCLQAWQKNFFSGRGYIFTPQSPTRYTKSTKNAGYDYDQKNILYTIKDSSINEEEPRAAQNSCFIMTAFYVAPCTLSPPPRFQEFDHVNIFRLRKVKLRSGKRRVMQGPH